MTGVLVDAQGILSEQIGGRGLVYRREGRDQVEEGVEAARRHASDGFGAMKLKVGFGVEAEYVCAIREAMGPGVRLMMDASCAYNVPAARRHLLEVRDAEVHFFEEPLAPEDLEGYKALRHLSATYVAAGDYLAPFS